MTTHNVNDKGEWKVTPTPTKTLEGQQRDATQVLGEILVEVRRLRLGMELILDATLPDIQED